MPISVIKWQFLNKVECEPALVRGWRCAEGVSNRSEIRWCLGQAAGHNKPPRSTKWPGLMGWLQWVSQLCLCGLGVAPAAAHKS